MRTSSRCPPNEPKLAGWPKTLAIGQRLRPVTRFAVIRLLPDQATGLILNGTLTDLDKTVFAPRRPAHAAMKESVRAARGCLFGVAVEEIEKESRFNAGTPEMHTGVTR